FYGLMRVAEFTTPDRADFDPITQAKRSDFAHHWDPILNRPYWSLRLPRTKTGVPGEVFFGRSDEFDCPYSAISHMFRVIPTHHSADPAFNFGKGRPLRRSAFISAVRNPLIRAGMAEGILGHSFRIGGATILAAAGYPDHIIKLAGRWTS